ncbi:hypothetical protein GYB22_08160 [bacterium]|nr:hypothetical protein [bacterium]
MKFISFLLLLAIAACTSDEADYYKLKTDWELNNVKGKPSKMVKWLYSVEVDSASGQLKRGALETIYTYNFNKEGYLTSFLEEVPSQNFSQGYNYNGKGYVLDFFRVEMGDTLRDSCALTLNDKGWVIEEVWYENGETKQMTYLNEHDEEGNIVGTKALEPGKEVPKLRQEYDLDENGNRTEIRFYDSQDALRQKHEQRFNEDNELTVLIISRLVGENWLKRANEYQYSEDDEIGNWTRQMAIYNVGDSLNQHYKWTERQMTYFTDSTETQNPR